MIRVAQSFLDGIVGDLFIARIVTLGILFVRAECVQTCLKSIIEALALLQVVAGLCAGCFDKDGSVVFGVGAARCKDTQETALAATAARIRLSIFIRCLLTL